MNPISRIVSFKSTAIASLCFAIGAVTQLQAAPYTGWASDYTGAEIGTLALWKFDEPAPAANAVAGGASMSFSSVGTATGVAGKFGQAFQSSPHSTSNNSFASAGGSASVFNASELSVDFWFKPAFEVGELAAWNTLFDKSGGGNTGIWLRMSNQGALTLLVGNGSATRSVSTDAIVWDADSWYNIAVTFKNLSGEANGDSEIKIFINGELKADGLLTGFGDMSNSVSQDWRIAQRRVSGYGSAPGLYDNFRVSNIAYDYAPIPEPASMALTLVLLAAGGSVVWKRRRANNR